LAFHSKETTQTKDVREQGAEEDIWAYQEGGKGSWRKPLLAKYYYRIRGWGM